MGIEVGDSTNQGHDRDAAIGRAGTASGTRPRRHDSRGFWLRVVTGFGVHDRGQIRAGGEDSAVVFVRVNLTRRRSVSGMGRRRGFARACVCVCCVNCGGRRCCVVAEAVSRCRKSWPAY